MSTTPTRSDTVIPASPDVDPRLRLPGNAVETTAEADMKPSFRLGIVGEHGPSAGGRAADMAHGPRRLWKSTSALYWESSIVVFPNPVWLWMSGSEAMVAKPSGAAHTAGTAFSTCMAVATLADRTCSSMPAARVKLARAKKWVRMEGSPSMVNVQPCSGLGQCFGYSPPTVQSVSISMSVSPRRRPDQFHRWPAVVPARRR